MIKKGLIITACVLVAVYFLVNILPNLIGVPLAAYNSYQAWTEDIDSLEIPSDEESSDLKISEDSLIFPKPSGYVNDFEQILSENERNQLEEFISNYEENTTNEIAIITTTNFEPYNNIYDYALNISNEWGVGKPEKDNGLTIVVSRSLKELRISTGYGTEEILTDAFCKSVIDEIMIPEFKNGDYYNGLINGLQALTKTWSQ